MIYCEDWLECLLHVAPLCTLALRPDGVFQCYFLCTASVLHRFYSTDVSPSSSCYQGLMHIHAKTFLFSYYLSQCFHLLFQLLSTLLTVQVKWHWFSNDAQKGSTLTHRFHFNASLLHSWCSKMVKECETLLVLLCFSSYHDSLRTCICW